MAIARAMVNRPELILADEPTGNLDSESARDVLDLLAEFHRREGTVLLVTHDEQAAELRRAYPADEGRVGRRRLRDACTDPAVWHMLGLPNEWSVPPQGGSRGMAEEQARREAKRILLVDDDQRDRRVDAGLPWRPRATRSSSPATATRAWRWPSARTRTW